MPWLEAVAAEAVAVVDAAFADGVTERVADPVQAVLDAMWQPVYREVDL